MCDEDPKPGSSKEIHSQDDSTKDIQNMTLAEYLALPENKNANLVQPLSWCPHLTLYWAGVHISGPSLCYSCIGCRDVDSADTNIVAKQPDQSCFTAIYGNYKSIDVNQA